MIKPSTQDDAVSVISQISHNESFNIKFSRSDDNFPYQKVSFESFDLPPKLEKYPSDVRWISPSISPRFARYFSAVALDNKRQRTLVYIWELDHKLKKASIKHHYKFDKVKVFDVIFVSTQEEENSQFDTHSFGILTENKFFYYHMETGSLINSTKIDDKITKVLDHEGSYYGKFYMIACPEAILSFNIVHSKKCLFYEENSPKKFLRNKKCVCISNTTAKIITFELGEARSIIEIKLEGIDSHENILDCMFTKDLETFYYLADNGLYEVILVSLSNNYPINKIIDFENMQETRPVIGELSPEVNHFITSDLRSFTFWTINQVGQPDMIYRQDFLDAKISFDQELIIIIDPHRINILYYKIYLDNLNETANGNNEEDNEIQDQTNIWLTPEITSIYSCHFTPDNTLLLIIDQNNAALWSLSDNTLLMNFFGKYEYWNKSVKLSPDESDLAVMSTKATENMIQIWDYSNGKELFQLFGFNAFTVSFSSDGYFLAAGAMNGPCLAVVWDLENHENEPLKYNCPQGNDPNYSYKVNVLLCGEEPENMKIICISDQSLNCLVFDYLSRELYADIPNQDGMKVDFVREINATYNGDFFSCLSSSSGTSKAYLYAMNHKKILRVFQHCITLQFSGDGVVFMTKTLNPQFKKDNKLFLWKIEENLRLIPSEINLDVEENYLLTDNRCLCSVVPNKNEKIFVLIDLEEKKIFGEIVYTEKNANKKFAGFLDYLNEDTLSLKMFSIQERQ